MIDYENEFLDQLLKDSQNEAKVLSLMHSDLRTKKEQLSGLRTDFCELSSRFQSIADDVFKTIAENEKLRGKIQFMKEERSREEITMSRDDYLNDKMEKVRNDLLLVTNALRVDIHFGEQSLKLIFSDSDRTVVEIEMNGVSFELRSITPKHHNQDKIQRRLKETGDFPAFLAAFHKYLFRKM
ncbi:uncharacterized protein LOC129754616 isoform X2 [Uranotaenia lowii]|uniref:uncharacterized protein LOC129754616 isoform X2 n=1 Tax=Uranotaenia lowii TaxID=190385 RepID=UPI00247A1F6D|nr:uncharacterized protein LOC129754616 isoform X2 [Uranotaenia lowii]